MVTLWSTPGTSGLPSTISVRRATLRILGRRLCRVFAGSGQRHLWAAAECALFIHSAIRVHQEKTQVWNRGGVVPSGIEVMEAVASITDPEAIVWRGDTALQGVDQGVRILGTPLGHPDYVRAQVGRGSPVARFAVCVYGVVVLLRRSGHLHFAGGAPELTAGFAAHHDAALHRCLSQLLGLTPARDLASFRPNRASSQPPAPFFPLGGLARLRGTIGCSWLPRAQLGRTCARRPSRTSRLGC